MKPNPTFISVPPISNEMREQAQAIIDAALAGDPEREKLWYAQCRRQFEGGQRHRPPRPKHLVGAASRSQRGAP